MVTVTKKAFPLNSKRQPQYKGDRVVLVHVQFPSGNMVEDLDEFKELAISAGAQISAIVTGAKRAPEAKYFVGSGKAEEIRTNVLATEAQLVIFNHVLTPAQERNLERLINCRVLDRTGLILDIFAQRARSFEGKLQVELAQLKHLATRLIRVWTHLERQQGGIGLRGPGETQLETDRRLIRNKIKHITAKLDKLRKQRALSRQARQKATIPTVALVGYTNAGKSTLFNQLTGATVYVADQLFATLDPTLRRVDFSTTGPMILADTVGFIRHLPHDLVEAFHATLEEVTKADLLLHVIDVNDEQRQMHIEQVEQVLASIQADQVPRILVCNKIDLRDNVLPQVNRDELGQIKRVFVSAKKNQGILELIQSIGELLGKDFVEQPLTLSPEQAKLRAALYERDAVVSERIDEAGNYHLVVRMPHIEFEKFLNLL
ncbi:MAG TPA: ribosome rescue GTPase HflX [Gammaproteobacteria bacterium]|nr:ribosome rescue GTPase HflX [Gammaproteobacteria bacterium]